MNNITKRTLTGAVYIGVILAATCINPFVTASLFTLISIMALYEFYRNADLLGIRANKAIGHLVNIIFMLAASSCLFISPAFLEFSIFPVAIFSSLLIAPCITLVCELFHKTENPFTNVAYTFLSVIYLTFPISLMMIIVAIHGFEPLQLLSLFIFAWCNDTFAYLVGCKWGKHRLFERISPKKSWEGFIGGVVATLIAATAVWYFYGRNVDGSQTYLAYWIGLALIMSIFGTLGDLVESMFKRQVGVKDSGNILPGHGGILDRFDSFFIAIPVVFVYLLIFN
ncbi:MAG: phosphatidate cytidylyltransferase [Bacteroidales bacterium]|jgi:phosphatidate cytidylyltransferase|nr:phosphatidate cytidylyltransferase [Bacteroidales bacterium]